MDVSECPDCGVPPGDFHIPGCDVEQCPYCGGQLISCTCVEEPPLDDRMPWTGTWPGKEECRRFGFYAKMVPGLGWVSCGEDEPGAIEDLNRLQGSCRWDREHKRFMRAEQDPIPFGYAQYLLAAPFDAVIAAGPPGVNPTNMVCIGDIRQPDLDLSVARAIERFKEMGFALTAEECEVVHNGFAEFLQGLEDVAGQSR